MTYNPNIPLVTESPKTSASPIQVNFSEFVDIFSRIVGGVTYNHMPFNGANQGKHAAVLMENNPTDPGVTQDLVALYNKNATSKLGNQAQLFAQIPKFLPTNNDTTDADNAGMQLTYNKVNTAGPQYQSFLIGGYLIYMGSSTSGTIVTLTPTPTEILMVQLQTSVALTIQVTQPDKIVWSNTLFPAQSWFVIGKA